MRKSIGPVTTLAAVFVLLLAVNFIATVTLRGASVDLTEEGLYTLSEGSQAVLDDLEHDIAAKLFYSRKAAAGVPRINQYAERVIELLRQYEAASDGKVTLQQLEPRPDTEVEEWALQYGLQPISLAGVEDLYFGLVLVSEVGDEEVVPFLTPEREAFLEYDITRLLAGLGGGEQRTIGILSSLDVVGNAADPMVRFGQQPQVSDWTLVSELRKQYAVRSVAPDAEVIDADLDLLLVIHPKGLSPATLYAVDQFVMAGGQVLVAVDPLSSEEQANFPSRDPSARFQASFSSDLEPLFAAWGVEMPDGKVVADSALATQVRAGARQMSHPTFLSVGPGQCNQDQIASAELESLLFVHSGHVRTVGDGVEGLDYTPLIRTTERAGLLDGTLLQLANDPAQMLRQLESADAPLTLALKISGRFPSAYPDGPPPADDGAVGEDGEAAEPEPRPEHRARSEGETTVFVVADTDFLTDSYSARVQRFLGQTLVFLINDNITFAENAAEVLSGGAALAGLRTRGKSDRPFTLVQTLEQEAAERWKGVEEELLRKQEETNRRLSELERGKTEEERAVLSRSQLEEVQRFREELAQNKRKLREVRRNLRQDIESLGTWVKFINIGLMPGLVILAGFVPIWWRNRRARNAR